MAYDPVVDEWARTHGGYAPVDAPLPGERSYAPVDAPLPGEAQEAVRRELGGSVGDWVRRRPLPRYVGGPYSTEVAPTIGDPERPSPSPSAPPDWAPPPAHMVEPMTPEAIPAAGRAVAGVAAPPPLPKLFGGGYLYPRTLDEALSEVETARLRGEIGDEEAARLRERLPRDMAEWQRSVPGLQAGLVRSQQDAAAEQGQIAAGGFERHAQAEAQMGERFGELRDDLRARQAEAEEAEAARQRELQAQQQRYDDAVTEMRDFRIDPDRYMSKQGGWDRARIAIALALGGIGSALTGTPNAAMQMFMASMDRDLESQRAELQGRKDFASGQQNVLAMMRQRFDDDRVAEAAARKFMLDELAFDVQRMGAQLKSADQLQARDQLLAEIQAQAQQAEQQMAIGAQQLADAETMRRRQAAAFAAQQRAAASAGVRPLKGDFGERYIPELGMVAANATQAKEISETIAATKDLDAAINAIENYARTHGVGDALLGSVGFSEDAAKINAIVADAQIAYNKANKLGALDKGAQEVLGQILTDPSKIGTFDAEVLGKVDAARSKLHLSTQNQINRANLQPIAPIGYDEKGRQVWGLRGGGG